MKNQKVQKFARISGNLTASSTKLRNVFFPNAERTDVAMSAELGNLNNFLHDVGNHVFLFLSPHTHPRSRAPGFESDKNSAAYSVTFVPLIRSFSFVFSIFSKERSEIAPKTLLNNPLHRNDALSRIFRFSFHLFLDFPLWNILRPRSHPREAISMETTKRARETDSSQFLWPGKACNKISREVAAHAVEWFKIRLESLEFLKLFSSFFLSLKKKKCTQWEFWQKYSK